MSPISPNSPSSHLPRPNLTSKPTASTPLHFPHTSPATPPPHPHFCHLYNLSCPISIPHVPISLPCPPCPPYPYLPCLLHAPNSTSSLPHDPYPSPMSPHLSLCLPSPPCLHLSSISPNSPTSPIILRGFCTLKGYFI